MRVVFVRKCSKFNADSKNALKIAEKLFIFEINASEFFDSLVSTNKGTLVIGSQCVKKRSEEVSCVYD